MKFVTSRDVRNNPSEFRETVEREDVVLTVGGKPFAIAVGVDEDDIEETLDILRRLRALRAMARMQSCIVTNDLNHGHRYAIRSKIEQGQMSGGCGVAFDNAADGSARREQATGHDASSG